jgi:hypothetical protein
MFEKVEMICTTCGYVGTAKMRKKGSFLIEILLYLIMILPGALYTVWRLTTREKVCPACKNPTMIPTNTPKGQALLVSQKKP